MIAGRRWAAIIAGITVAGAAAGTAAALQADTASAGSMPVVVIDAGHGGIDAGVYGVNTAVKESDINLVIAKKLRGRFVNAGFECVMTRTTNGGLYGNTSKGFKMRDMQQRRRTIEESGADMVISIHQNTCPLPSRRGSHVFYEEGSPSSRELANDIQYRLNALNGGDNAALTGDYYILKCSNAPSVIVECGFLSNWEDCAKLQDENYQDKLVWAIHMGVLKYMNGA